MANHVCPWWMGYLLANPLRRFLEKPDAMLGPFIQPGMVTVDYGAGMGFFTLPMARMVGNGGKVIAVDVQQKMLDGLMRRARRAGLGGRIEPLLVNRDGVTIDHAVDFVAALHVVHELPDAGAFFRLMRNVMKPGAKMLVSEPGFHVTEADFQESVRIAAQAGFTRSAEEVAGRGRTAVLVAN